MLPDFPSIVETVPSVPIIEDCSTAFGSTLNGKSAGTFGALGILGLEERDVLTAGGGAVLYALDKRSAAVIAGKNTLPEVEIPDMNAALALTQLREARRNQTRRGEIAGIYTDAALRCRHKRFTLPSGAVYNDYAFALVVEEGLPAVVAYAERKGVAVERAFADTLIGAGLIERECCPVAASLALRTALFPLYPRLSATSVATVARLIQTLP
jgi:dTDP-4-amino-4,6-dideoxygalactose transaminase